MDGWMDRERWMRRMDRRSKMNEPTDRYRNIQIFTRVCTHVTLNFLLRLHSAHPYDPTTNTHTHTIVAMEASEIHHKHIGYAFFGHITHSKIYSVRKTDI